LGLFFLGLFFWELFFCGFINLAGEKLFEQAK
jgi:hypothetical protein